MFPRIRTLISQVALFCALLLLLAACDNGRQTPPPVATPTPILTSSPLPATPTPIPPTSTPEPLAALVNGEPITLAEYQAELARAQAGLGEQGQGASEGLQEQVLDELVDQVLLAQAASQAGFVLGGDDLQARIDDLSAQVGGQQGLDNWVRAQGYTEQSFRQALARSIAAAWMRDHVIADLPETAEQVHARQILLYNSNEAKRVYNKLQSGTDFATLAAAYDPEASGDLGWFPRGYLTEPALEKAAFALQVDEYSEVIETRLGFHILQVIERDPERPLEPEARMTLQLQALRDWLGTRRNQSEIQILLS